MGRSEVPSDKRAGRVRCVVDEVSEGGRDDEEQKRASALDVASRALGSSECSETHAEVAALTAMTKDGGGRNRTVYARSRESSRPWK